MIFLSYPNYFYIEYTEYSFIFEGFYRFFIHFGNFIQISEPMKAFFLFIFTHTLA